MKIILGAGLALALTAGAAHAVSLTYDFSGYSSVWSDQLTFSSTTGQGPDVTVTATDYYRDTGVIQDRQHGLQASVED
ncbi:hypothetical protein SAMN05444003_0446 [Cognatiyoonia sediminum]|uniref:PEP-CTERM sorting domain-containing protein n=1 Tax=Cognatiyoonia sediminum TaxID=1508389 RepID=A0A1M5LS30_9RHOB|nr:hypothetical protein [Cognatiyoonia sediminum]SHG67821.1 hypothetical protein SAMN05444003_0446 [Cognatiyoonia sediminum]